MIRSIMDELLLKDALADLNLYRDFIIKHDIHEAIESSSNYLAALGLSTYTEVFGGFYRGDLSKGNSKKNYYAFIENFFHEEYMDVDAQLVDDGLEGLYGAVRSGLVHEYLIKDKSIVVMYSKTPINCGIIYCPNGIPSITFVVDQYFADFKDAFTQYYHRIQEEEVLLMKFVKALKSINSNLPRSKKIL